MRHGKDARQLADVALMAELIVLGLVAGLSPAGALRAAASEVGGDLERRMTRRMRGVTRPGDRRGAVDAEARLHRIVVRSAATGRPSADVLRAFAGDLRRRLEARASLHTKKLPVRLLFPLALLILPGFIVLVVGPAVLTALERLGL